MSDIKPLSAIDPGDLLIVAARNAEHITPELQRSIAEFMRIWSAPTRLTCHDHDA